VRQSLMEVVDRGTGTAVRRVGYKGPAAGKTGTTNGSTDTWFVGFTPQAVAAVWIGFDEPRRIMGGAYGTGGHLAAPVWGRIMVHADSVLSAEGVDSWEVPEEAQVALDRGRTSLFCPQVRSIGGRQPVAPDSVLESDSVSSSDDMETANEPDRPGV